MKPYTNRVALGRLEIDFSGSDFIADGVREEIVHQSVDCSGCAGRLSFKFGHAADAGESAVCIDDFEVAKDIVRVGDRLCHVRCDRTAPYLEVTVTSTSGFWKGPLVAPAVRLIDQSLKDSARRLSKRLSNPESRCFIVGVPKLSIPDDLLRSTLDLIVPDTMRIRVA